MQECMYISVCMLMCMHVCVYVWRMTLMSKPKQNSSFVVRKYRHVIFTEAMNFASYVATALPVNSVSVTNPARKIMYYIYTLGIWGAKSFFFRDLGGLAPLSSYVEPRLVSDPLPLSGFYCAYEGSFFSNRFQHFFICLMFCPELHQLLVCTAGVRNLSLCSGRLKGS